jgi:NADH dehydrogenase [ubiquinone] 1 alpha subcomplex assembly factor 5
VSQELKVLQRDIAARLDDREDYEYLHDAVAERLVDRLDDITRKFPIVLDLGCRSGHICRALCDDTWNNEARGGVKTLIQCDSSLAMVTAAQNLAVNDSVKALDLDVHSLVVDEEHLPFAEDKFDLAMSSLSLHWVNDLPGALAQVKHSLKPDGVFIGAMLGGETLKELRSALLLAEQEREGGVGNHISPFAQVADCGQLMQRAGFNLPTVDTDLIQVDYPDAFTLMSHLGRMGENNAVLNR